MIATAAGLLAGAAGAVTPAPIGPAAVSGAINVNFGPLQQYSDFGSYTFGSATFDVGATPTPYITVTKTPGSGIYAYNTVTYGYQVGVAATANPTATLAGIATVAGATSVTNDSPTPGMDQLGYYQLTVSSDVGGSDRANRTGYGLANQLGTTPFTFDVGGTYLGTANGQDVYGGTLKLFIYASLLTNASGSLTIDPTVTLNAATLAADGYHGPVTLALSSGIGGNGGNIVLPGAVPEPATWAMMVAGFGLVGRAARRRRGVAA